jgi:hypothetical protein
MNNQPLSIDVDEHHYKYERISLAVSSDFKEQLNKAASKLKISRSLLIRSLVMPYLKQELL